MKPISYPKRIAIYLVMVVVTAGLLELAGIISPANDSDCVNYGAWGCTVHGLAAIMVGFTGLFYGLIGGTIVALQERFLSNVQWLHRTLIVLFWGLWTIGALVFFVGMSGLTG